MLPDRPLVTVATLTFRRPGDLAVLLPQLVAQAGSVASDAVVEIVVVDNDPDGGAREAVEQFAALHRGGASVVYLHEPEPGISAGRNRALAAASASDLLVFIDDDERPTEDWLQLMLATYLRSRPAAVVGRVVSEFDGALDPWIQAGGFFDRRSVPTGTIVSVAATNNLLLDMAVVRALDLSFDPAFGITGGGDTMFTRQLVASGAVMVWCDEAVVFDSVPASRMTRRWVLNRALRSGNSWTVTSVRLQKSVVGRTAVRLAMTASGAIRLVVGSLRLAVGIVTRRIVHEARGSRTQMRGVGMIGGAWGYRYQEYRRAPRERAKR